jgi:hypothetical protein
MPQIMPNATITRAKTPRVRLTSRRRWVRAAEAAGKSDAGTGGPATAQDANAAEEGAVASDGGARDARANSELVEASGHGEMHRHDTGAWYEAGYAPGE